MKLDDTRESRKFHWMTWAIIGFFAATGYVLFAERPAHFASFLPFVLLLACPLMHLFHHGSHARKDVSREAPGADDGIPDAADDARAQHRHG